MLLLWLLLAYQVTVLKKTPDLVVVKANYGKAGTVLVRVVGRGEGQHLEIGGRRLPLEWNIDVTQDDCQTLWLHPKSRSVPILTARDWDGLLVITFPDGLRKPAVAKMFSDASSSISATSSYTETDKTGTTIVVQEISEQDAPTIRIEYRWVNGEWKAPP